MDNIYILMFQVDSIMGIYLEPILRIFIARVIGKRRFHSLTQTPRHLIAR